MALTDCGGQCWQHHGGKATTILIINIIWYNSIPVVITVILVAVTVTSTSNIEEIFDVSFLLGKAQVSVLCSAWH